MNYLFEKTAQETPLDICDTICHGIKSNVNINIIVGFVLPSSSPAFFLAFFPDVSKILLIF